MHIHFCPWLFCPLACSNVIDLGLLVDFSKNTEYDEIQLTSFVREIVNMTTQVFTFSSSKSHLAYLPFSTKTNENIDGQWLNNQYIQTIEDDDKEALNRYLDKVIIPYVTPLGWESGTVSYMTLFCIISLYCVFIFFDNSKNYIHNIHISGNLYLWFTKLR